MPRKPYAQVGLEFLLTYGWAVVVVTTIAALLIVTFSAPSDKVNFSAGGRKIVIKASSVAECGGTDSVALMLQNFSGGEITITNAAGTGSFEEAGSSLTIDGSRPPVVVSAGRQIRLEKIGAACGAVSGSINVDYTDQDGLQQNVEIKGLGNMTIGALPL